MDYRSAWNGRGSLIVGILGGSGPRGHVRLDTPREPPQPSRPCPPIRFSWLTCPSSPGDSVPGNVQVPVWQGEPIVRSYREAVPRAYSTETRKKNLARPRSGHYALTADCKFPWQPIRQLRA